jgi:hypothetical protein
MWIAEASPILAAVSAVLKKECKKNPDVPATLAKLANTCAWIVAKDAAIADNQKAKDELFVAMTLSIITFDRATSRGAFTKDSGVNMRKCLRTLKSDGNETSEVVMGCVNSIK